jgi:RHS repeat-associated protein
MIFDHPDEIGSATTATDCTGNTVNEKLYYPFGEFWTGYALPNLGMHQEFAQLPDYDPETDQYNTLARHYSPSGRWMSPDWSAEPEPVPYAKFDDPQTLNLYAYLRNNPLNGTDPDGHCCWDEIKASARFLGQELVGAGKGLANALPATYNTFAAIHNETAPSSGAPNSRLEMLPTFRITNLGQAVGADVITLGIMALGAVEEGGETPATDPPQGRAPGPTIDPNTGQEVGRFVVDPKGNAMIEPEGGSTISAGQGGADTDTTYPNGSNYQRLKPNGHGGDPTAHGHGHLQGTGPGKAGQGPSISPNGTVVKPNTQAAHWPMNY